MFSKTLAQFKFLETLIALVAFGLFSIGLVSTPVRANDVEVLIEESWTAMQVDNLELATTRALKAVDAAQTDYEAVMALDTLAYITAAKSDPWGSNAEAADWYKKLISHPFIKTRHDDEDLRFEALFFEITALDYLLRAPSPDPAHRKRLQEILAQLTHDSENDVLIPDVLAGLYRQDSQLIGEVTAAAERAKGQAFVSGKLQSFLMSDTFANDPLIAKRFQCARKSELDLSDKYEVRRLLPAAANKGAAEIKQLLHFDISDLLAETQMAPSVTSRFNSCVKLQSEIRALGSKYTRWKDSWDDAKRQAHLDLVKTLRREFSDLHACDAFNLSKMSPQTAFAYCTPSWLGVKGTDYQGGHTYIPKSPYYADYSVPGRRAQENYCQTLTPPANHIALLNELTSLTQCN